MGKLREVKTEAQKRVRKKIIPKPMGVDNVSPPSRGTGSTKIIKGSMNP